MDEYIKSKEFECKNCHSKRLYVQKTDTDTGLFCRDCGKWIQWLTQDEVVLAKEQIGKLKNPIEDSFKLGVR